jgi:hypothetical protein
MAITHSTHRLIQQAPDVVRARLLGLAERIRLEMPPIEDGDELHRLLGVTGSLGVEVGDRDGRGVDIRTTRGRIRGAVTAAIAPEGAGTALDLAVTVRPDGMVGSMMFSAAKRMVPDLDREFPAGVEHVASELAAQLEGTDEAWAVALDELTADARARITRTRAT